MSHKTFFTPGPTQIYFTVPDHLKSALDEDVMCISHRSKAFEKIYAEATTALKSLLDLPEGYHIYFLSSANEIWERIIQNLVKHKSHHFVNGSFSKKFYQFAQEYKKDSTICKVGDGLDFDDLSIPEDTELISCTLNETSIGYAFEAEKIYALRKAHPDKLLAVDGVSAFPAVAFDFSMVDTAYFSVQKCFGLPAGLGVWIVNDRCLERAAQLEKEGLITGSYHRLASLHEMGLKNQNAETPNVLGLYLLGKVANDLLRRSAKTIQQETAYKAAVLYQAIEKSTSLRPFVTNKANQSKTVVVAHCEGGSTSVIERLAAQSWVVGSGYSQYKTNHIRIANFPMHSKEMVEMMADMLANM